MNKLKRGKQSQIRRRKHDSNKKQKQTENLVKNKRT